MRRVDVGARAVIGATNGDSLLDLSKRVSDRRVSIEEGAIWKHFERRIASFSSWELALQVIHKGTEAVGYIDLRVHVALHNEIKVTELAGRTDCSPTRQQIHHQLRLVLHRLSH